MDWATNQTVADIERCGYHGKVILRSDQEVAITDYLREVARKRYDLEIVIECSQWATPSQKDGHNVRCAAWRSSRALSSWTGRREPHV